jgi:hypothetical protein
MLTEKDYCDYETCVALKELRFNTLVDWYFNEDKIIVSSLARDRSTSIPRISLYEAQKWLREEKGIHIAPRIYLYHDINLDEHTSWECTIYVEWSAIYTIGKSLTYEEALLLGIKEAVKILKEK